MTDKTILALAVELAEESARKDAATAIEIARTGSPLEAVHFITGNSYMPPLRAFGRAEDFWQASHECEVFAYSPWEAYCETFQQALEDAKIYLGCLDYDNALYVVDTAVWEISEAGLEGSAENLSDEWSHV